MLLRGVPDRQNLVPVPESPETRYARSGEFSIAYQVVGEGEFDLVYMPGFASHLEVFWEHPAYSRFLRRLASFRKGEPARGRVYAGGRL